MRFSLIPLISLTLLDVSLNSCRAAAFRSRVNEQKQAPLIETTATDQEVVVDDLDVIIKVPHQEVFKLEQRPPIDILWVIDNTGSMEPLIAKLQQHFWNFYAGIEKRNDIRSAIISAAEDGPLINGLPSFPRASFKLPQVLVDKGVLQVTTGVGNNNALALASSAICPIVTTDIGSAVLDSPTDRICNVSRENWNLYTQGEIMAEAAGWHDFTALKNNPSSKLAFVKTAAGQLNNWYSARTSARKILAIVSNDNVNGFGFPQYFKATAVFPGSRGFDRLFAFVHTDKSCMPEKIDGHYGTIVSGTDASPVALFGCLVPYGADGSCAMPDPKGLGGRSEVGSHYLKAIRPVKASPSSFPGTVSGKAYSICKDDWAEYFSDMTKVVVAREFILKETPIKILKASIDSHDIEPTLLQIEGNRLTLDASLFTDQEQSLTITYEVAP